MLNTKTAVITGASRGIGRATALAFAKSSADVALIYAGGEDAANAAAEEARAFGVTAKAYQCDVADFEKSKAVCDEIAKDFGKVDILVNNAGVARDGLLLSMREEDFDAVINVNLKGAFNFTKHLARYIMKSPAGRVINISSIIGLSGNVGQANYAASKAGLIGLTKSAAKEFAGRRVTVNAIAPGFIETDMTAALPENARVKMLAEIPLKRFGSADEVAALAVFLASDAAGYITGEVIKIDGGMCV